jgi:hypothetical protein
VLASLQEVLAQLRAGRNDVFAIVEHQQHRPGAQHLCQLIDERSLRLSHTKPCRYSHWDKCWVREWGKLDQPDSVGIVGQQTVGDSEREPRLPNSSRASERHQSGADEQMAKLVDGLLTSYEAAELILQVVIAATS